MTLIAPATANRKDEEKKSESAATGTTANATNAVLTTYVRTPSRNTIRKVRHHLPATSLQLRLIAAPSPMFSTNIIGTTAIQLTQIQAHSGMRQKTIAMTTIKGRNQGAESSGAGRP